jgi:hypothetical protein
LQDPTSCCWGLFRCQLRSQASNEKSYILFGSNVQLFRLSIVPSGGLLLIISFKLVTDIDVTKPRICCRRVANSTLVYIHSHIREFHCGLSHTAGKDVSSWKSLQHISVFKIHSNISKEVKKIKTLPITGHGGRYVCFLWGTNLIYM